MGRLGTGGTRWSPRGRTSSGPFHDLVSLLPSGQDAKISFDRIRSIQEEPEDDEYRREQCRELPEDHTILLENLTFQYPGTDQRPVLDGLNLQIPHGTTLALVGASGSGS